MQALLQAIKFILPMTLPFIQKLIESKVVPILKRKTYERFDDFSNDMIEKLVHLKEKAENESDGIKKEAHLEGLNLGADTLRAIGAKLIKAADEIQIS